MMGGSDIVTSNYYPNAPRPDSFEAGSEFMDFVTDILQKRGLYLQPYTSKKYQYKKGESLQGWEVKLDARSEDTGRLSIEVAEKAKASNPIWVPSGIYRSDNTWLYIQGNYKFIYIFMKHFLVSLHKSGKYPVQPFNGTIKRFFIPIDDAINTDTE